MVSPPLLRTRIHPFAPSATTRHKRPPCYGFATWRTDSLPSSESGTERPGTTKRTGPVWLDARGGRRFWQPMFACYGVSVVDRIEFLGDQITIKHVIPVSDVRLRRNQHSPETPYAGIVFMDKQWGLPSPEMIDHDA